MLDERTSKTCSRCGETKPLSAFLRLAARDLPGRRDPYRPHCKVCRNRARAGVPQAPSAYARFEGRSAGLRNRARRSGEGTGPSARTLALEVGPPSSCYLCGGAIDWHTAHLDHTTPVSRGGTNRPENLAWTCRFCNTAKGSMTVAELLTHAARIVAHLSRGSPVDAGWSVERALTTPVAPRKPRTRAR